MSDTEMVARMLLLREHEGADAADPMGTGFRLHLLPGVIGGERWRAGASGETSWRGRVLSVSS